MIQIIEGHVFHARSETAKNSFSYPIFNIYFSSREQDGLSQLLKSKFKRLLQFRSQDYLLGEKAPLHDQIKRFVSENFSFHEQTNYDNIYLQTIPRMFGYAFNPVSFWYFYQQNRLTAVMCEVNNTFGERHYYWLHQSNENLLNTWLRAEKQFHVSPFFDISGNYLFKFVQKDSQVEAHIKYVTLSGELRLMTWIKGEVKNLADVSFFKLFFRYGWMTPLVVLRIHYQAIKLFFKRVQFFSKPKPPQNEITHGSLKGDG